MTIGSPNWNRRGDYVADPIDLSKVGPVQHVNAQKHDEWRPADEAPENVAVLVHIPGMDYYGNNGVYAAMLVNMGTGKRWMTFGWSVGRDCGIDAQPTSWRPMAAPPQDQPA